LHYSMQHESYFQIDFAQPNTAKLILQTPVANNYVVPSSMEKLVLYLKQRYKSIPLYITENGRLLGLAKSTY
jgi:beta-glucosidase/6-phospho-beta-glucosidase/beta-galactosidase